MVSNTGYTAPYEKEYCTPPEACLRPDVLILGSAVGLYATKYLFGIAPKLRPQIVVADAGCMDLLTHVSNMDVPRYPLLQEGAAHFGGKLCLWGTSAPRPPVEFLSRFPYPIQDLDRRFSSVEAEIGVSDPIPYSDKELGAAIRQRLTARFPDHGVRAAPLAIDRFGRRWSPIGDVPDLAGGGVKFLSRFLCTGLDAAESSVTAVRGTWLVDGRKYVVEPRIVVLALGVEGSLPLVRQLCPTALRVEAADHIRIDLHGSLPAGFFGDWSVDKLGVAVFLMDGVSRRGVPYHLEIKVAPWALWRRFMPSGDNLRGRDDGETIYAQIQVIAAMHDRLPGKDLLNIGPETALPPVMSSRDAVFHGELVNLMAAVAESLGLSAPTFSFRPLLANHHLYGAFRVGKTVSDDFLFDRTDNLYILPPTSYVDVDDDANPTLKSLVLAQYAMESLARRLTDSNGAFRRGSVAVGRQIAG